MQQKSKPLGLVTPGFPLLSKSGLRFYEAMRFDGDAPRLRLETVRVQYEYFISRVFFLVGISLPRIFIISPAGSRAFLAGFRAFFE